MMDQKKNALDSLERYRQDPRFTFFRWERNRGVNLAWFQLLTKVQGRYRCAPGSDDVLAPNFLQKRVTLLEAHRYADSAGIADRRRSQKLQKVTKYLVGFLVLLTRSLFGDGTPRRFLGRVAVAKPTSAPLRF